MGLKKYLKYNLFMYICTYILTYVLFYYLLGTSRKQLWSDVVYKTWSIKKIFLTSLKSVNLCSCPFWGHYWICLILVLCSLSLFLDKKNRALGNWFLPSKLVLSLSVRKFFELLRIMHLYWLWHLNFFVW